MSTWVLLRGLTRESRHWSGFAAAFAEQAPDAHVIALDLPGNGRMNHLRSPLRVEAMAQHCRAELRAHAVPPPYHLLAMSLGAMVATAWAAVAPDEIERCVLVNTSLRPFNPFWQRLRPASYLQLLRLMLWPHADRAAEEAIFRLTSRQRAAGDVLERWVAWRRDAPVSRANALRQLWAAARYRAPPQRPAPPTLLLASRGDCLVDSRCSLALVAAWRCALATHPNAGHDLPLDDAPWVARQVREWLRALGD